MTTTQLWFARIFHETIIYGIYTFYSLFYRSHFTLVYAVLLKEDDANIGYVQLVPIGDGKWEIGYHIAKQHTCKGYATEAVRAFLPIVAKKVGVDEVYGIRLLENEASGRVLEKCGFEIFFEGEGAYHDGVYVISKSIWR